MNCFYLLNDRATRCGEIKVGLGTSNSRNSFGWLPAVFCVAVNALLDRAYLSAVRVDWFPFLSSYSNSAASWLSAIAVWQHCSAFFRFKTELSILINNCHADSFTPWSVGSQNSRQLISMVRCQHTPWISTKSIWIHCTDKKAQTEQAGPLQIA